jgi:hypothetical protein
MINGCKETEFESNLETAASGEGVNALISLTQQKRITHIRKQDCLVSLIFIKNLLYDGVK